MVEQAVSDMFNEFFDVTININGLAKVRDWISEFGEDEVLVACDIVCSQYDDAIKAFTKMYGVLYNRRRIRYTYFGEDAKQK